MIGHVTWPAMRKILTADAKNLRRAPASHCPHVAAWLCSVLTQAEEGADRLDTKLDAATDAESLDPGTAMVRVDALRTFTDVVTKPAVIPSGCWPKFKIDPAILNHRHAVMPYRSLVLILEHAAAELHCPDFGMRLATSTSGIKVLGPAGVRHAQPANFARGYFITAPSTCMFTARRHGDAHPPRPAARCTVLPIGNLRCPPATSSPKAWSARCCWFSTFPTKLRKVACGRVKCGWRTCRCQRRKYRKTGAECWDSRYGLSHRSGSGRDPTDAQIMRWLPNWSRRFRHHGALAPK